MSLQLQKPVVAASGSTILLSFCVRRPDVLYAYLLCQPLPFFFLSRTKQGQPVLLSVFTEGLMTHVQATIPPTPLRSTVACTFNIECHGDQRQQRASFQETTPKQTHQCLGEETKPHD